MIFRESSQSSRLLAVTGAAACGLPQPGAPSRSTSARALRRRVSVETAPPPSPQPPSPLAWSAAVLSGGVVPALALLLLPGGAPASVPFAAAILAVGLMGTGMISAAAAGRLGPGVLLAGVAAGALVLLAHLLGMPSLAELPATALAMLVASVSFAARGALFARSAAAKGWWIAVGVVAGEAAMLGTAAAMPGALPVWLLALLPAQWASMAIGTALSGAGALAAWAPLLALAGTAAATLLVARLWPRRWPYAIMFTTWLALSAAVLHHAP